MKDSIKALREKHNYSQSYLATYLQVSRQMYIKYESGEVEPPVKVVVALAKLYSVSYSQIIDDEFSPNKEKVSYKIQQDTESYVASPSVKYGFYDDNSNNQLGTLTAALKTLSEEALVSDVKIILLKFAHFKGEITVFSVQRTKRKHCPFRIG